MASTRESGGPPSSVVDNFPTKHLPAPTVRDIPEPPDNFRRVISPGIVAAGVEMASGELSSIPTSRRRSVSSAEPSIAKTEATTMSSRTAATLNISIFSSAWYTTGASVRMAPMTSSIPIAIFNEQIRELFGE